MGKTFQAAMTDTWEIFDHRSLLQNMFLISARLNFHQPLVCSTIRNGEHITDTYITETDTTFVLLRHFINTSRKIIVPENVTLESFSPHCGLCCMRLSISTPLLGNITVVVDWDVSGWLKCCDNSLRRRVHIASPTFRYRFWFFFNLFL